MTPPYAVQVTACEVQPPSTRTSETVERKGLGHPDTLADLVAETFCYRYAHFCLDQFDFVPNHSADKVTLAGADATVHLGGYEVVRPVGAYLFGKVTRSVAGVQIPVEELFASAVDDVLVTCTRYPDVTSHVEMFVRAVVGSPIDHHPGYYNPSSSEQLESIVVNERFANDTVACAGSAPFTPTEQVVIDLERYMQSQTFVDLIGGTGSDIKVLASRRGRTLDLTTCLPFHPEAINSWGDYGQRLAAARKLIEQHLADSVGDAVQTCHVLLNGRDVPARGYLAPFGTCLGKGDVGAVGRGNRYSGVIAQGRPMSIEAPAGKNLLHHTGKIYTLLAQWISEAIVTQLDVNNQVIITSKVGNRLDEPGSVGVDTAQPVDPSAVEALVRQHVADFDAVTQYLLASDPLAGVRESYGLQLV